MQEDIQTITYNIVEEEEDDGNVGRPYWNDASTKLFIEEFKSNYELWRTGKFTKKKKMWERIMENINARGFSFTVEQVQNRYKTLRRRFKRTCFGLAAKNERAFPYQDELSDIFSTEMSESNANSEYIASIFRSESSNDEVQNQDDVKRPAATKLVPMIHGASSLPKKKPVRTHVDVLVELKELIKKVEIRRQVRHEQNLEVAKERNEILQRKNLLLEQILLKLD